MAKEHNISPSYYAEFCRVRDAAKEAGLLESFRKAMSAGGKLPQWVAKNFPEYHTLKAEKQRLSALKSSIRKLVTEHKWTEDQIVMVVVDALHEVGALSHSEREVRRDG